ncbi:MAG: hypothetical protein AAFX00_11825 [Pseudomonadota bacterium]
MSFTRICLPIILAAGLAACDRAYPVAVVGEHGMVFRGTAANTFLEGGEFFATNGRVTCTGSYDKHVDISEVSFPVLCNNGLSGVGTAFFQSDTDGGGFVTMVDGSRWQFIFGSAAERV